MKEFLHSIFDSTISDGRKLVIFTGQNTHAEFFEDLDQASTYAATVSVNYDTYFGLGLVAGKPAGRGKRPDMCGIGAVWADIDMRSDAHEEKRLPETEDEIHTHILDQLPLKPSAIIYSGHGVHAYWFLQNPLLFDTPEARDSAEKLTKGWHELVCQTAAKQGWHIDNLGSLAQVLRVPGTWNYKIPDKPVQVTVNFFDPSIRYPETQIRSLVADIPLSNHEDYAIDSVVLDAAAQPPESKFAEAIAASPKFKNTWERNRLDLTDKSQSGYDMSLATMAVMFGWNNQEIADLIIAARRTHNIKPYKALRPDYIARTIANARKAADENGASMYLGAEVDTSAITGRRDGNSGPAYQPFPVEVLPEPIRSYVVAGSESLGCDPAYIALPVLAVAASCIGNSAKIVLKRDWIEPCVLWTVVIGESGTMKSPAFKLGVNIIKRIQYNALRKHKAEMDVYSKAVEQYEIALAHAKKSSFAGELPEQPKEPAAQRILVSDVTSEAIAPILIHNPKGVLCAVDELATWVRGFDRYVSGGKGADVARWLSMYDADSLLIDRKTQDKKTISVPSAAVSLTGTIQPGVFTDCFKQKSLRESGLVARILIAMPPAKPAVWCESEIPIEIEAKYESVIDGLMRWQPVLDENGMVIPAFIGMSANSKQRFIEFVNEHADEAIELSGDLAAVWSKLKGASARLALIFECIKTIAANPSATPDDVKVGIESVESAIAVANWFKSEATRIYDAFCETDAAERFGSIIEFIKRKDGVITARGLMRGGPCFETSGQAQRTLNEMVNAGLGHWRYKHMTTKGGKHKAEFVLQ